jgi:glycylpeptide N-tetradecanoyltransferase
LIIPFSQNIRSIISSDLYSAIPVHMNANSKAIKMAEVNFLCVHKSLRDKRLAPTLIKEVTRRVNRCNIW